ncbi:integrase, catalytic region, zinc finger, CCHC-type containing protein [Tanacetum coccineum]
MANVSKSISIPNEEFSDDTTPSVARKFLNEHKALELEIEHLLRAVVSQDIMSIMQNNSVVDTSNLQTELERTKERFENCIIKKENEYAKLWNDWYKKCEECKYDKISYDKAYNDMQQKIERLQAQLGDHKGKSKDTPCVSNTLDPLPQKLENENVELEFQVRNYEKENAHLKTAYKNLFDSINVTRAQTKLIIDSLQNKLHDTIYENAKLRAQLFDKVSEQKDTTKGTSTNTKFANQSTERKPFLQSLRNKFVVRQPNAFQSERPNFSKTRVPQKVDKTNDLSNPVTSNSVPTTKESKVVENDKVIALGMFRINTFKNSREVKYVPNKPIKASVRTNPITVPQPHVITKKAANSDSNGFSFTGVDITTKTKRPQPRSNTKNDRVPSASKSSRIKNKEVEVEDHPRNLLLSKNKKHMSSECNNIKLAIHNDKSEIVCAICLEIKNVGSKERLASPKPSKPRMRLRWSPTGKMFDIKGKLIASSESNDDNACTPNPQEPTIKRFPNSTFFLGRLSKYFLGTIRFGNDHVAAILGLGDHQWGNILITRVYFIEGLGHNLFLVGQFCDSDLENIFVPPVSKEKAKGHLTHPNLFQILCRVFLRLKDEAPEEIKTFLKKIIVPLQAPVIIVRTDNDTEFKNQVLQEYFNSVGITHQASSVRTPQQNEVVERRNHTLVEASRTMLIFSRTPLFLWDEAIATACYTQNRSLIHRRFDKTPYELINGRKPDISFLHVLRALCYPKNDREDIRKLGAKSDIGFFIGYSANSYAYRVYNQRTKKIMETMNVTFDELSAMAFEQNSLKPGLQSMTPRQISLGLDLPYAPSTITTKTPTKGELDLLFEAMYDDHVSAQPSTAPRTVLAAQVP